MSKDYSDQFKPPNGNVREDPVEKAEPKHKAVRDSKGRFMKGNKLGKAGVSKNKKEVMAAMKDLINNPDTFAAFQSRMLNTKSDVTFLEYYKFGYSVAYGKPGIRKEDRSVTVETMDEIIRPVIVPDSVMQEIMKEQEDEQD